MLEKIKEMLSEYLDDVDGITEDMSFIADIGLSSLDFVTFLGEVEEEFSLPKIKEEDIPQIVTVRDLIELIEKQGQQG